MRLSASFLPCSKIPTPTLRVPLKLSIAVGMGLFLTACSTLPNTSPDNPKNSPTPSPTLNHAISSPNNSDNRGNSDFKQKIANARHEYQLENGLKVIIKEDHRAPVVMSQIWYRVGSDDEPQKLGGISHLLEHMMFKGTSKVSSADFERIIAKFGGSNNAFTTHDYTGYYEVFPANRLGLALELEADRMTNLQLKPEDFTQERQVVMEERRQRTDDNPNARAYEQFGKMASPDSPKSRPVIGAMTEIEAITLADLQHWYKTWYTPSNATIVIVGDVQPETALAQVKRYFAKIPARPLPARPAVTQKAFRGYSEKTASLPVQVPSVIMAYNVPSLTTLPKPEAKTAYTLELLAQVLDGGLSARLERKLVRDQSLLAGVSSGYSAFSRGDTLFSLSATPRENVTLDTVKTALLAEIDALKTQPITPDELQRAKTGVITDLIYSQDSISGQAQLIGSLDSIGLDDRLVYDLPTIYDTISEQDLHAAAQKYLVKDNLTVLNVVGVKDNPQATTINKTAPLNKK